MSEETAKEILKTLKGIAGILIAIEIGIFILIGRG